MIKELYSNSTKEFGEIVSSIIIDNAFEFIKNNGCFSIAFPGGKMPISVFKSLKDKVLRINNLDLSKINVFWLDDRFVPHDHLDSNYKLCNDHFLKYFDEINCYPIPNKKNIFQCAELYEKTILKNIQLGSNGTPKFDMILIGIGDDGHIASLFPNSNELNYAGKKIIIPVLNPPFKHQRITFTIELLNAANKRIIGVKGAKKVKIYNSINLKQKNDFPLKYLLNSKSNDCWVICP